MDILSKVHVLKEMGFTNRDECVIESQKVISRAHHELRKEYHFDSEYDLWDLVFAVGVRQCAEFEK